MRWLVCICLLLVTALLISCKDEKPQAERPATVPALVYSTDDLPDCCKPLVETAGSTLKPATRPTLAESTSTAPGVAASPSSRPASPLMVSTFLAPATRPALDLDWDMTDQDGRPVNLADFRGKPIVLSFMFTRCPNPSACPLVGVQMAGLAEQLAKHQLADRVNLVLITYDPMYDTPDRLKAWATRLGIPTGRGPGQVSILKLTRVDQLPAFNAELGVDMRILPDGSINHLIEMWLLDREGRFVRQYVGEVWKNGPVLADLDRLLAEPAADVAHGKQTAAR